MKKTFFSTASAKFISAAFIAASLLLATATTQAATTKRATGEKTTVQYTGKAEDGMLVKLNIANDNGADFTVTVKNEAGETLYSRSYNDKDFSKQFKLLKADHDNQVYYFTISSSDKSVEQSFEVNTFSRFVDDVVITKK